MKKNVIYSIILGVLNRNLSEFIFRVNRQKLCNHLPSIPRKKAVAVVKTSGNKFKERIDKFESVKERFYDALVSKTPAEFSIACDCAVSVFINKADEQKKLLDILKKSAEHKFYIGDT